VAPNGLTTPDINHELAWVLYTHHLAVFPITGPPSLTSTTTTVRQPPCDFIDSLDAIDARTGKPLGGSGGVMEAEPIQF